MAGCEIALDVNPNFKTHREALEGGVDEVVIRSAIGDPNVRTVIHG